MRTLLIVSFLLSLLLHALLLLSLRVEVLSPPSPVHPPLRLRVKGFTPPSGGKRAPRRSVRVRSAVKGGRVAAEGKERAGSSESAKSEGKFSSAKTDRRGSVLSKTPSPRNLKKRTSPGRGSVERENPERCERVENAVEGFSGSATSSISSESSDAGFSRAEEAGPPEHPTQPPIPNDYLAEVRRRVAENRRYPLSAVLDRAEGSVVVKFVLNERGRVVSAEVVSSSGRDDLDAAALEAVKTAHYPSPPFSPITLTVEVRFEIGEEE